MFPYGTQYFREPNPPETEWEKDFERMAECKFNIVKIWAMWSWIHVGEDAFDFDHFDRMFELAEKHGLKLLINTILENAPYWLARKLPETLYETSTGTKFQLVARSNTPGGAWPGLCWDNEPVRERAERFLKAVAGRYRNSEALWGYDVWNEVFFEPHGHPGFEKARFCYCDASKQCFTDWLHDRYGDLDGLNGAWRRKYTSWDEVYPPPYRGPYPDWMDWLRFRIGRMRDQMRWRVATLRAVDDKRPMTSHGVAWSLDHMAEMLVDDWDIAEEVDQWGLSTFPAWQNMPASDHMRLLDIARSAATGAGKRFWQTELQGGPAANGLYRSFVPRATDTAFWNWTAFTCGADGLLYWQWRPEPLGPEAPGFGLCRVDGSPTDRTEAASWFAGFMNGHQEFLETEPVAGDVAVLVLPESQLYNYVMEFDASAYSQDAAGLYQALWDRNVVVDFVKIDRIGQYKLVYLPFPLCIERAHVEALKDYVSGGGTLISHACPAHFDDHGYCSFTIPGGGLDEVFGALEDETEFVPSLVQAGREHPEVIWDSRPFPCAVYQEKLIAVGGEVRARFSDGCAAVIDSNYGGGKARLIGTFPGHAYRTTGNQAAAELICEGLAYAGVEPAVAVSDRQVKARLRTGPGGIFLWTLNAADDERTADISIAPRFGGIVSATDLKTGSSIEVHGNSLRVRLSPRCGSVAGLRT
ncbi:MAG: beta-galactosidase [Armatimonadota bacterium]|nr:beta-galactosidase [Armatimonadota bacterium]